MRIRHVALAGVMMLGSCAAVGLAVLAEEPVMAASPESPTDAGADVVTAPDAADASTASVDVGSKMLGVSADDAEAERARVAQAAAVAAARASLDQAQQKLRDMKQIGVDYERAANDVPRPDAGVATRPADAGTVSDGGTATDTTPTERQLPPADLAALRTRALAAYPEFEVMSADVGGAIRKAIDELQKRLNEKTAALKTELDKASKLEDEIRVLKTTSKSLRTRLRAARLARCKTAYCFGGDGTEYAFEPMLELPIGTSFAFGEGALARFANGNDFSIQFTAGLRFWMMNDYLSLSVYFARPVFTGNDTVVVPGSSTTHPASEIRRLGPSVALGLFGDILFVGAGFDQLRNGNGSSRDPAYEPNQVLSRAVTISIGIAPFTAIRNVAGASSQ